MNIEQILDFLAAKQVELEAAGEPEEIAFQLAVTYLTEEEVQLWHEHNRNNKSLTNNI